MRQRSHNNYKPINGISVVSGNLILCFICTYSILLNVVLCLHVVYICRFGLYHTVFYSAQFGQLAARIITKDWLTYTETFTTFLWETDACWPQIYIFYSWMRHWPITQQQQLWHSTSDNRSKITVYFLIRRPTSEYLTHIVYSQTTTVFPQIDARGSY